MITYVKGNIFDSNAEVLVNPTNCRAVMGAGLAKEFSRRYPGIELWYKKIFKDLGLSPGDLYIYPDNPSVLCFPTKNHWKEPSEMEYIEDGLMNLIAIQKLGEDEPDNYSHFSFHSIAFPRLGCGLGGLVWEDVRELMEFYLDDAPFDSFIYE
jgi:O-acetyl-ADP-ribose deacetylase (regulator of RNase III)